MGMALYFIMFLSGYDPIIKFYFIIVYLITGLEYMLT